MKSDLAIVFHLFKTASRQLWIPILLFLVTLTGLQTQRVIYHNVAGAGTAGILLNFTIVILTTAIVFSHNLARRGSHWKVRPISNFHWCLTMASLIGVWIFFPIGICQVWEACDVHFSVRAIFQSLVIGWSIVSMLVGATLIAAVHARNWKETLLLSALCISLIMIMAALDLLSLRFIPFLAPLIFIVALYLNVSHQLMAKPTKSGRILLFLSSVVLAFFLLGAKRVLQPPTINVTLHQGEPDKTEDTQSQNLIDDIYIRQILHNSFASLLVASFYPEGDRIDFWDNPPPLQWDNQASAESLLSLFPEESYIFEHSIEILPLK